MQRLIQAQLYGSGLVLVDLPGLIDRYNDCLRAIGQDATSLDRFHVDGKGWSPEIAEEKGDPDYLSHDPATQMAIIITPDQRDRPLHHPSQSFDRLLLGEYFERHGHAIADITATHGLWLEIDLGLSHFESAEDLLLVRRVILRAQALGLMRAALAQQALVQEFNEPGDAWFDPALRAKILSSARAHGDLRLRNVGVAETRFDTPRVFHSRSFGGVFVFRSKRGQRGILIVEDRAALSDLDRRDKGDHDTDVMDDIGHADDDRHDLELFTIDDAMVLDRLHQAGFVEIDLGWYRRHPESLAEKWQYIVADLLCSQDPALQFHSLSSARIKKRLIALKAQAPSALFELERLVRHLRDHDGEFPLPSTELQRYLLHPADGLNEVERSAVWQLLCRLQPHDPVKLYRHDKALFYREYNAWPESKRNWAVHQIQSNKGASS